MYCMKCGKELSEQAQFCMQCGTSVGQATAPQEEAQTPAREASPANAVSPTASATPVQKPKKKKKVWIPIVIGIGAVLLSALIAKAVRSADMVPTPFDEVETRPTIDLGEAAISDTEDTYSDTQTSTYNTTVSEYEAIFSDRYIVDIPSVFTTDNYAAFAVVDASGMIDKLEYVYDDNDIVLTMIEKQYYSVEGYTDTQKAQLQTSIETIGSSFQRMDFATVEYNWGTQYYTMTITFDRLDNEENIETMHEMGLVPSGGYISMSNTETSLLADGYVKK